MRAMVSLETFGYYSNKLGIQHFLPVFNFIMFLSNLRSRALLHHAMATFRAHSDFPVKGVAAFGALPGVNWSDHGSFWSKGYRALMVLISHLITIRITTLPEIRRIDLTTKSDTCHRKASRHCWLVSGKRIAGG
jgi:hypothetical protein